MGTPRRKESEDGTWLGTPAKQTKKLLFENILMIGDFSSTNFKDSEPSASVAF